MTFLAIICLYDKHHYNGNIRSVNKFENKELAKEYIVKTLNNYNTKLQINLNKINKNHEDYSEYIKSRFYFITDVLDYI